MINLTIALRQRFWPAILGWWVKVIYSGARVRIGKDFRCDSIPSITVDPKACLVIGDHVILRQDVEIRVNGQASLQIGANVRIDRGVRLLSANCATLLIGDGTRIGLHTVFNGGDSITVGCKCLISGFVFLQTSMHCHKLGVFVQDQGYDHRSVTLGDDVWLGVHAVIMPGCSLGNGVVVGSNSVVTKSIEANSVVVGIPARIIKMRQLDQVSQIHAEHVVG